jgi:hypothetical protein
MQPALGNAVVSAHLFGDPICGPSPSSLRTVGRHRRDDAGLVKLPHFSLRENEGQVAGMKRSQPETRSQPTEGEDLTGACRKSPPVYCDASLSLVGRGC